MMTLLRDLPKEFLRKFFGEEMGGGQGDPDPFIVFSSFLDEVFFRHLEKAKEILGLWGSIPKLLAKAKSALYTHW